MRRTNSRMLFADIDENKIRVAWPAANVCRIESRFEFAARCEHLTDVPIDIGRVFKRCRQAGERERIHAVWRKDTPNPPHQFDRTCEQAKPKAGEPIGF